MSEPTNEQRAEWARTALRAFAKKTGDTDELKHDEESVVTDLLCDLMHMAPEDGVDFERALRKARSHFHEEVHEVERDRAINPHFGDQTACRLCDADIEYHGSKHGWIDRGGNHLCNTPGPRRKHKPRSDQ